MIVTGGGGGGYTMEVVEKERGMFFGEASVMFLANATYMAQYLIYREKAAEDL